MLCCCPAQKIGKINPMPRGWNDETNAMEKNECVERKNQNPNPGTTCSSSIALVLHTHLVNHQNNHDPPHLKRFAFCCLLMPLPVPATTPSKKPSHKK
jgi:hypothetical protein